MAYFHGRGVPLDIQSALAWMRRAADQNHVEAQLALGVWYENGEGVEQDDVAALMWFLLAGSNDHELALEHLEQLEDSLTKRELERAERTAIRWVEDHY